MEILVERLRPFRILPDRNLQLLAQIDDETLENGKAPGHLARGPGATDGKRLVGVALRCRPDVRRVQRQTDEGQAANQVAD